MDKADLSHSILNILERLRIMHGLIKDQNYSEIPKEEILNDLNKDLDLLKKHFDILAQ
jgi:hypothetical protein